MKKEKRLDAVRVSIDWLPYNKMFGSFVDCKIFIQNKKNRLYRHKDFTIKREKENEVCFFDWKQEYIYGIWQIESVKNYL